mgnify:CR=1 FL=1
MAIPKIETNKSNNNFSYKSNQLNKEFGIKGSFSWDDIDALMNAVKNCSIPPVVKSLPTDECVEQWWAEGQDQNEGFWQEAPYRTNGDVVEEIKIALKYFIETWQG